MRVWNAKDRKLLAMTTLDQDVRSVAISPDGLTIAAGLKNGSFAVLSSKDLSEVSFVLQVVLHFYHLRS